MFHLQTLFKDVFVEDVILDWKPLVLMGVVYGTSRMRYHRIGNQRIKTFYLNPPVWQRFLRTYFFNILFTTHR